MLYRYNDLSKGQQAVSPYAQSVLANLTKRITDPAFPCYFAKKVLPKNSLYLTFVENLSDQTDMFRQGMEALSIYAEIERNPDPYRVFVLSFDVNTANWEQDNQLMWQFIHYLIQHDPQPWSPDIPQTTDEAGWSVSFMGMPWFFNLNSHNHTHRNSRNVTDTFSLIIQRTDSFEKLLSSELNDGQREQQRQVIRKEIRGRVAAYDGQSVSPALAGEPDNLQHLEWVQFHIPNLNTEKPQAKCPFMHQASAASFNPSIQ